MTSAGFQCRIYAVDVHRFLLHQQGSNRFEYYTEVNILSVTDSSLNTSGVVGMRFNPSVVVEEYVVLLGAFHLQSLESFSIFEGFGGIDTEHGVAQGGVQFAEHRLPQSDRTSFDDTGQRTSDGIAFAFYLIYKVCHFLRLFRVRTTYIVCFDQVEIIVGISAFQFDGTDLRCISCDADS